LTSKIIFNRTFPTAQARVGVPRKGASGMWQEILVYLTIALGVCLTLWRFQTTLGRRTLVHEDGCVGKNSCGRSGMAGLADRKHPNGFGVPRREDQAC
jgi:hypothetical protein